MGGKFPYPIPPGYAPVIAGKVKSGDKIMQFDGRLKDAPATVIGQNAKVYYVLRPQEWQPQAPVHS